MTIPETASYLRRHGVSGELKFVQTVTVDEQGNQTESHEVYGMGFLALGPTLESCVLDIIESAAVYFKIKAEQEQESYVQAEIKAQEERAQQELSVEEAQELKEFLYYARHS